MAGQGGDLEDEDEEAGDSLGGRNGNGKRGRDASAAAKGGMLRFATPRYPMFENRDMSFSSAGDYGVGVDDLPFPKNVSTADSDLSVLPLRYGVTNTHHALLLSCITMPLLSPSDWRPCLAREGGAECPS